MPGPKPPDIQRGQVIRADWLNQARDYGIKSLRVGPGLRMMVTGGGHAAIALSRPAPAQLNWQPAPFTVTAVAGDYLTATPVGGSPGDTVTIAKPPAMRSGTEVWTTTPDYVPGTTVIWAAPFYDPTALDGSGNAITLMDMNVDQRGCDLFWMQVTASTGGSGNIWQYSGYEVIQTLAGFSQLTNGRSLTGVRNGAEANNTGDGIEGNGIDLDGQIFTDNSGLEMQPIQGSPVVLVKRTIDASDGTYRYAFSQPNAIDGECAA